MGAGGQSQQSGLHASFYAPKPFERVRGYYQGCVGLAKGAPPRIHPHSEIESGPLQNRGQHTIPPSPCLSPTAFRECIVSVPAMSFSNWEEVPGLRLVHAHSRPTVQYGTRMQPPQRGHCFRSSAVATGGHFRGLALLSSSVEPPPKLL